MASDNNPGSPVSDPIGNANDTAQQEWLELDQPGAAGETLKAKKWTTQRRVVDDSSHHGNIHTGTEQVIELDKSDTLQGEVTAYQSLQGGQTRETESSDQQQFLAEGETTKATENRTDEEGGPVSSLEVERVEESVSAVAQGGGADPLVFDEHFDDATANQDRRGRETIAVEGQPTEPPIVPQPLTAETPVATVSANPIIPEETVVPVVTDSGSPTPPEEEVEEPEPVIDSSASAPVLNAENASGLEDTSIELDLSSHLTDSDGSESLSITISGVPEGAFLSAGSNRGDGTWELNPEQLDGLSLTPPADSSDTFSLTITSTSTERNGGQQNSVSEIIDVFVEAVNDAPVIDSSEQITRTEESMEGFSGYGETWEGDVYSIVTQAEMLEHLGISDVDSDSFTVSLANASPAWHEGIQSNDSAFTSDTLTAGSSQYDETVVQVTQEFLDNYPSVDAQVGDFYFDHVDFDALSEGEIANVSFSVQVSDGEATSAPQEMNIQVTGSNDAPTISATVTLPDGTEDNSVTFNSSDLLANSTDVDAQDTLFVTNLSVDPEQGNISTNPDGSFTFTPEENFNGEVAISYDVTDGVEIVPTSASLTVNAVNDNPIAVDDSPSNSRVQLDGNNSSLVADSSIIEDNSTPYTVSIDVTPDPQDYGYIISNGGQTGAASGFFVTRGVYGKDNSIYQIGVSDENQSLIFQGGTAVDGQESNLTFSYDGDTLTVYQDGVDITDTGTIATRPGRDLPMQNLSLGAPSNILTSYEFKGETDNIQIYDSALDASEISQIQDGVIPDPGGLLAHYTFEGDTGLEDRSGFGHTLQANGDIQFTEINDPNLSTSADAPLTITAETLLANDSDVDGDRLNITAVSEDVVDSNGNIVGTAAQDVDGNIVFTPADSLNSMSEGEATTASFSYTVSDGQGGSDTATATINIAGANDAPTAMDDTALAIQFDIPEGGNIVSTDDTTSVVTGEIVAEGDTGSSIDQWTFHHNGGPVTIDTLSESGSDFTDIDGDGVKDHIDTMMRLYDSDGNQVAMNDDSKQGTTDGSTNDTYSHIQDSFIQLDDLPPGNYSLAIGSWELTSEEVAADHNDNYDTIYNYDHVQDTGPYQITITGDHSLTQPDPLTTNEDSSITIMADTLLANDSDVDGDNLSITSVQGAENGQVQLNDDNSITFTPDEDFNGTANFSYTVSDGHGETDTATVSILVNEEDDTISVLTDTDQTVNAVDENAAAGTTVGITAHAADPDAGDIVSYSLADDAAGRFAIDSDSGEITVAAGADLDFESNTAHQISVTATSSDGTSSNSNYTVSINDIKENIAPVAVDDASVAASWSDNLIVNSDAEAGETGWITDSGDLRVSSYAANDWADKDVENTEDGNYFYGNGEYVQAHQDIDISSLEGGEFNLSADMGAYAGQTDSAELKVIFKDAGGNVLDQSTTGAVVTASTMEQHSVSGTVPEGAVTATLEMHMDRDQGSDADGYFDNISFVVGDSGSDITTDEDSSITIDVLANDTDVDGNSLTITQIQGQDITDGGAAVEITDNNDNVLGTAQLSEGKINFTPGEALDPLSTGEAQQVQLNYTVSDGQGGTDTATATINVTGTDNDLTYVSETAGYKNVVGLYQTDADGNPIAGTVVIDDQNGMASGSHLADLEPGTHEFFIIP